MAGKEEHRGQAQAKARTDAALFSLVVVATLAHVAYYFPRVVDDLFISLRYAENLAHGRGAVYNMGERVEGYSSPLWMFVQAIGFVVHVEGVTWTKLCGVLCLVALEYGLFRLTRDAFSVAGPLALLPSAFVAANSYVVNWGVLGLETPAHLALLVLAPMTLHRALRDPTSHRRTIAVLAMVALGTSRPESPLYVVLLTLSAMLDVRSRSELRSCSRELARIVSAAGLALAVLLAIRYGYYGHVVPNTYFVKGKGEGFEVHRLAALWAEGASLGESTLYLGGTLFLVAFAIPRRVSAPALFTLACLYFTASVRLDWMPSLRHLLPVTVLSPLGYACLGDAIARRLRGRVRIAGPLVAAIVPALAAASVVPIDNRNSPEENRGRGWIRPKLEAKWQDTMLAYRRIEPPHVTRMRGYDMGQITQAWHVLEGSSEPVSECWFIGRDIGAVGYYTGAKVYDTAGLFTEAVSHSPDWTERHRVTRALITSAMAHKPIAGEFLEGWEHALGENQQLLNGYRIRRGSRYMPIDILATDRPEPTHEEVERRYRAVIDKLPKLFHLHTLYGESLGSVLEKRLRMVKASFLAAKAGPAPPFR